MTTETMPHTPHPHTVAHQFDDATQQREASELGMWIFLCTEIMFFGGLFLAYAIYRHQGYAGFAAASHKLDVLMGTFNTAILLTSSLFMVFAAHAAEHGDRKHFVRSLSLTIGLGTLFLLIKAYEYYLKYEHGLMPLGGLPFHWEGEHRTQAHQFFNLYYLMTVVHALHMVIGLAILGIYLAQATHDKPVSELASRVHITGLYWHFVDVVWVFLFPLLYLI